jgi:hypothetical protein
MCLACTFGIEPSQGLGFTVIISRSIGSGFVFDVHLRY